MVVNFKHHGNAVVREQFGFVQGRLIQSPPDVLQWFPQDHWEHEFSLASSIGADYIELIVERQTNPANPIWTDSGIERILDISRRVNLPLPALCNDFVIDHNLFTKEALDQNTTLIERTAQLGVGNYILPLFEASDITPDNYLDFITPLRYLADLAQIHNIVVCMESNLPGTVLIDFFEHLDRGNVSTVFDTGNRISKGHDLAADILLLGRNITHVHLKDKNAKGDNVLLGTGLVNFLDVFNAFRKVSYSGTYTFETTRGTDPIRTAQYHLQFARFFLDEALNCD